MLDATRIAEMARNKGDVEATPSMVHYYAERGLLPKAVGRGRHAYPPEALTAFLAARELRTQGLGLDEISRRLAKEGFATGGGASPSRAVRNYASRSRLAGLATSAGYVEAVQSMREKPRTLRFRGGYSLTVPPGATDEEVARIYAAVEAAIATQATEKGEGK